MQKKRYSSRYQFNIALNEEEYQMVQLLKKSYSVNISGCFKRFLKEYMEKLNK